MNRELGLRILADLMEWTDQHASAEYRWLRVMSALKYDGYQDFAAGKRFIESLIAWLKQFKTPTERAVAYTFVRERLVYIGPAEMQQVVRLTYPDHLRRQFVRTVAARRAVAPYEVWTDPEARRALDALRRRTLFVGLSDGARIDVFRRANVGVLSNEQIVAMAQFADDKWKDVLGNLREEVGDETAQFEQVVLLDDFMGSGKSLLRRDDAGKWKGKLVRFHTNVIEQSQGALAADWRLTVHHYVAAFDGSQTVGRTVLAREQETAAGRWFPHPVTTTFTLVLPESMKLDAERDTAFLALAKDYYDPAIMTKSLRVGGESAMLGFDGGALPLVLDHNTPNNSVALLWAESPRDAEVPDDTSRHAMRPLFRRRQRHL